MKINKKTIYICILSILFAFNLTEIYKVDYLNIRNLISFIFLFFIPGFIILRIITNIKQYISKLNFWEYLIYSVGLSIFFLIFIGFFINLISPFAKIMNPLSQFPLLVGINTLFLIITSVAYKKEKNLFFHYKNNLNILNMFLCLISILFPIFSAIGAITLNNNKPEYFTITSLLLIFIYSLFITIVHKKINKNVFPFSLIMIGASVLLMMSLRSWYIYGSDINLEALVFNLTKSNYYWSTANFPNQPYNACLSITILPTIISSLMSISDQYIFKLIYPILFSLLPLGVYLFSNRYLNNHYSFLAGLFFLSFPGFFTTLPMHNRQGIAFLFFVLLILCLFSKKLNVRVNKFFTLIFGISLIVSHYSTAYVSLIIISISYISFHIIKLLNTSHKFKIISNLINLNSKIQESQYNISYIIILILWISTFFWYGYYTASSNNLIDFIKNSFHSIQYTFNDGSRDSRTNIFNIIKVNSLTNDYQELINYTNNINDKYKKIKSLNTYTINSYRDYQVSLSYSTVQKSNFDYSIVKLNLDIGNIIKKISNLFIILGLIYLLFSKRYKVNFDLILIVFSFSSLILVIMVVIIPYISIGYSLDRIYQHSSFILSTVEIIGLLFLLSFIKNKYQLLLISLFITLYFLYYTGVPYELIGGYNKQIQFHNDGEEYDAIYTHKSDIQSTIWLSINYDKNEIVFADGYNKGKIKGLDKSIFLAGAPILIPPIIYKNSYVYLGYTNTTKNKGFAWINSRHIPYNIPNDFLNDNKNLIYNNKQSKIYK